MCMAIVGVLGGIMSAAGSIFGGMAQSAAYEGQAAAYKAQKKAMDYQAIAEANAGSYESAMKQDEGKRLMGKQVTGLASAGVDISSGTPGDILTDSASAVNMDVAAIRHNWQDKANLSNYAGKIAKLNAQVASNNAKMAMTGGIIGAISPLVSGFSGTNTSFS